MSTETIASDLKDLARQVHEFDYGTGSPAAILRNIVDCMMDLNDAIAALSTSHTRDVTHTPPSLSAGK